MRAEGRSGRRAQESQTLLYLSIAGFAALKKRIVRVKTLADALEHGRLRRRGSADGAAAWTPAVSDVRPVRDATSAAC